MSRYKTVIADFMVQSANYGTAYLRDVGYLPWTVKDDAPESFGIKWRLNQADPNAVAYKGEYFGGYEDTHLHDRLWLFPGRIDAGMIATQYSLPMSVWNSYQRQSMTITETTLHALDNVTLDLGTLPVILAPNQQKTDCSITIEFYGEASLNGYITIVHDLQPLLFQLVVTGLRIIVIPLFGNWEKPYQIEYDIQAMIGRTRMLYEQRKALHDTTLRNIPVMDVLIDKQKYINLLQAAGNSFFAIPVATEAMTPDMSGSVQGLTSIAVQEDIGTTHFNFTISTHVMLYHVKTEETEVRELAATSYAGQTIFFTIGIVADWDAEDVVLYPILFGCMNDIVIDYITDKTARVNFQLQEHYRS